MRIIYLNIAKKKFNHLIEVKLPTSIQCKMNCYGIISIATWYMDCTMNPGGSLAIQVEISYFDVQNPSGKHPLRFVQSRTS